MLDGRCVVLVVSVVDACSLSLLPFGFHIQLTPVVARVLSSCFDGKDTICLRMSGDDTTGRETDAVGAGAASEFRRNPARIHDVYLFDGTSSSTVTVYF